MKNIDLSGFFDQLDLTNSADLAIAFHHLKRWPETEPLNEEAFTRDYEIIEGYRPLIFGARDHESTCVVIHALLWKLGGHRALTTPGVLIPQAPREWLHVFREAHARGVIGPVAFGAAFRFLMVLTTGNGAPEFAPDSQEARCQALNDIRLAAPLGLMEPDERAALASLPDIVTIYRGGRGDFGIAPSEHAKGLHWALDREYAAEYLRGRGHNRTMQAIPNALNNIRLLAAGTRTPGADLIAALGAPFLIRADVPKQIVCAYFCTGPDGKHLEVLVDFEKLTPDMIEDVTPERYRWAA